MQFHYAPNTISLATALALIETETDVDYVRVDFAKAEQTSPAYLAINPKGRVPALVTDHGILTETGALLDYVAALNPDKNLIPDDLYTAAQMREVMWYLGTTMHVNHAHKMRGHRWADQDASLRDMTAKVAETMGASCAYLQDKIAGPYVVGDAVSLADFYLFTLCTWLPGDGVNITNYPTLSAHFDLMMTRPAVIKALEMGLFTKA